MKHSICFLVLLFILIVSLSPSVNCRLTSTTGVKEEVKHGRVVTLAYSLHDQMETNDSLNKLMGLEECEDEDGECINRRVLAEAHLDYIYTQSHDHP